MSIYNIVLVIKRKPTAIAVGFLFETVKFRLLFKSLLSKIKKEFNIVLVNQNGPSEAKGVFDLTNWTIPEPSWH